jgi:hypothetical protein
MLTRAWPGAGGALASAPRGRAANPLSQSPPAPGPCRRRTPPRAPARPKKATNEWRRGPASSRPLRSCARGLGRPRAQKKRRTNGEEARLEQTAAFVRARVGAPARPKKATNEWRRGPPRADRCVRARAGWGARAPKKSDERMAKRPASSRPLRSCALFSPSMRRRACARGRGSRGDIGCSPSRCRRCRAPPSATLASLEW